MTKTNVPRLRFRGFDGDFKPLHIGDILKIKNGKSQKSVEVDDGKYPILGTGGVIGHTNSFLCDKESVLIGRKGTINKPFYMNTPFWTVDTLFYSEIKNNNDAKFIYFLFNTIEWLKYNTSTGVPSLTSSNIEGIPVEIPEEKEQQKIGSFFSKLDKLIELQSQRLEQLKKLKQGYVQKIFPKNRQVLPVYRFSEFNEDWKEKNLNDYLSIPRKEEINVMRVNQIMTVKLHFKGAVKNNAPLSLKLGATKYYKRHKGQFIYGRQNFFNGAMSIVPEDFDGLGTSSFIPSFNVNNISTEFLYYYISRYDYYKSYEKYAIGTGSKLLYEEDFLKFKIVVPSNNEQEKIISFIDKMNGLINFNNEKLKKLKQQKKAYLQKMFI